MAKFRMTDKEIEDEIAEIEKLHHVHFNKNPFEQLKKQEETRKKYQESEKGKLVRAKYQNSEKGLAQREKYHKSPKYKIQQKNYHARRYQAQKIIADLLKSQKSLK